jgi:hypothetical protein
MEAEDGWYSSGRYLEGIDMDRGVDMGVVIDDAVPMPGARVVRRYPYAEMGVGQSFYVEGVQMQVVLNGNWRAGKKLGVKFIARREGDGIRVWRSE